jgi:hypothetical protein
MGDVGGLVGYNQGTTTNSYATGSVSGSGSGSSYGYVGGLVGQNQGTVSNSYATGTVTGGSIYFGGLVGQNSGTVSNSFWDTTTSGQAASAGGTGLTTAQMQNQANFTSATSDNGNVNPGWDFNNTWVMYDGYTYPLLRTFMTPLTVTANDATKTYDGLVYSGTNGLTYSVTPNANLLGTPIYSSGINAGSYAITPSGLYSNQQGYIISYVNGALTIGQAPLTVSGLSGTGRNYNGSAVDALSGTATLNGLVSGESLTLGGTTSGTLDSANAGSRTVSTAVTIADNGSFLSSNYALTQPTLTNVTIGQAPLSVSANNLYKSFGATDPLLTYNYSGLVSGDAIGNVLSGSLTRVSGENTGLYVINEGSLVSNTNYSLAFTSGSLRIVPLVEPGQPTTQVTQTSSTTSSAVPPSFPNLVAEIDSKQANLLRVYTGSGDTSGEFTQQWISGNGPVITILDGGVRMPDGRKDH